MAKYSPRILASEEKATTTRCTNTDKVQSKPFKKYAIKQRPALRNIFIKDLFDLFLTLSHDSVIQYDQCTIKGLAPCQGRMRNLSVHPSQHLSRLISADLTCLCAQHALKLLCILIIKVPLSTFGKRRPNNGWWYGTQNTGSMIKMIIVATPGARRKFCCISVWAATS